MKRTRISSTTVGPVKRAAEQRVIDGADRQPGHVLGPALEERDVRDPAVRDHPARGSQHLHVRIDRDHLADQRGHRHTDRSRTATDVEHPDRRTDSKRPGQIREKLVGTTRPVGGVEVGGAGEEVLGGLRRRRGLGRFARYRRHGFDANRTVARILAGLNGKVAFSRDLPPPSATEISPAGLRPAPTATAGGTRARTCARCGSIRRRSAVRAGSSPPPGSSAVPGRPAIPRSGVRR